jgi:hypothetical protein
MPTHSLHPDLLLNGLADGCEQCRVEAEAPMDFLDEHAMADLWRRMVGCGRPHGCSARPA